MAEGKRLALLPLNTKRGRGLTEPYTDPERKASLRVRHRTTPPRGGPANHFLLNIRSFVHECNTFTF
jgi:hypothetical protein